MENPPAVLLVEDEKPVRLAAAQTLELAGFAVTAVEGAAKALKILSPDWPGILVTDIRMPDIDGMELLRRARQLDSDIPVVLVTGHGDVQMAVQAMRDGAYDFIEKPYAAERLVEVVRRAQEKRALVMENRALKSQLSVEDASGIVGRTPAIEKLRKIVAQVADTDADVLIFGETGTGKEMVARALHQLSGRRNRQFVALNCGAMPETIFESELFGHEAGAFTGAAKKRVGRIEFAGGGTLFLDEIESMPMALQVKLLRVLQERIVEPLGSNEQVPVDLRVVAATKVNLKQAAQDAKFREDLYYRLNVVVIPIPPLRERRDDIPLLFQHFLAKAVERFKRPAPEPSPREMQKLMTHDWPGNVRELRNAAERFALGLGDEIDLGEGGSAEGAAAAAPGGSLAEQVEAFEKAVIEQALARRKGNVKAAIEDLGLPRKTFYDKMRRHNLSRDEFVE